MPRALDITFSAIRPGNNGWVCHAVVIDRTPLSTLKNGTCSVPIQAGCQAVSTFMISLSPSSIRHEPEYAIIVSKRAVESLSGRSLDVRIDIILSRSMTIWPSGLTPYVSAHSTAGNELSAGRSRGPSGSATALSQFLYLASGSNLTFECWIGLFRVRSFRTSRAACRGSTTDESSTASSGYCGQVHHGAICRRALDLLQPVRSLADGWHLGLDHGGTRRNP